MRVRARSNTRWHRHIRGRGGDDASHISAASALLSRVDLSGSVRAPRKCDPASATCSLPPDLSPPARSFLRSLAVMTCAPRAGEHPRRASFTRLSVATVEKPPAAPST